MALVREGAWSLEQLGAVKVHYTPTICDFTKNYQRLWCLEKRTTITAMRTFVEEGDVEM